MAFFLSPIGNEQQLDANGSPLNGGKIFTYLAGSTTAAATYTDNIGATAQANPIILNSLGLPASPIWLTGGITYKFIIKDSSDVTLRTVDNISGINDTNVAQTEWVASGFVPTFISTVSFSVPGDQTGTLQIGRRLQTANTAGTIYSRITNSVFAATITTVTVVNDSGVLDSGLATISYGLAAPINPSLPNSVAVRDTMGITAARQTQEGIAFTTGGTTTAYTITTSPIATTLVAGQRYRVKFNAANTSTTPTLARDGLTAKAIKIYNSVGVKADPVIGELALDMLTDVEYDGTDYVVLDPLPTKGVIQVQSLQTGAVATGTTGIPSDDTIPQQTEGDQYMSLSITPKYAASILEVTVTLFGTSDVTGGLAAALFRDATSSAVAAGFLVATAGTTQQFKFTYLVVSGSIAATTFKVRAAQTVGTGMGTFTFNGVAGARIFGGVMASSIVIKEILT